MELLFAYLCKETLLAGVIKKLCPLVQLLDCIGYSWLLKRHDKLHEAATLLSARRHHAPSFGGARQRNTTTLGKVMKEQEVEGVAGEKIQTDECAHVCF